MSYRKDLLKIYNKIDTIVRRGHTALYDYYSYIDELIDNGKYQMFQDVLLQYYKIDVRTYRHVSDYRKISFEQISELTNSSFQKQFKKVCDSTGVYPNGFHYYDYYTNVYLGDIKEVEIPHNTIMYKDPELTKVESAVDNGEIKIITLEITVGSANALAEAIPQFETRESQVITYPEGCTILYNSILYKCLQTYTWEKGNFITPTDTSYWTQVSSPTYSFTVINDDTITLLDKYKLAINIIKTSN